MVVIGHQAVADLPIGQRAGPGNDEGNADASFMAGPFQSGQIGHGVVWPNAAAAAAENIQQFPGAVQDASVAVGPAAAAFIPLAYTMIPNGGAFLLALLMSVSFASSQLSPTHICTAIISDYFDVTFFATVKKLLPLFLLTVLIACGYYMLLTAVF